MKGLLVKDLRIIMAQKRYMCMVSAIGILMGLTQQNGAFCIMYMTMIATIMAISTLNYDAYEENGMAYLMTLPVKRSTYVFAKYIFVVCMVSAVSLVFTSLGMVYWVVVKSQEVWMNVALYGVIAILFGILMMSIMLPVNLKFGAEKSRVVMLVFGGSVFLLTYALNSVTERYPAVLQTLSKLEELPGWMWGILLTGVTVLVLVISLWCACNIWEKKEF